MNKDNSSSDEDDTSEHGHDNPPSCCTPKCRRTGGSHTKHKPTIAHQDPNTSYFTNAILNSASKLKAQKKSEEEYVCHGGKKRQLCSFIQKNEFGSDLIFKGFYGSNFVTYLDYTASGRPLKCIEAHIQRYVLPTYANTHTEVSHNAVQTTKFREEARDIIRRSVNAGKDDCVVFTGSGVTSAINKLVHCLNLKKMGNVVVFIGPYEHHSNILPWVHSPAKVMRIPQDKDGLFDIKALALTLEDLCSNPKKACSRPFIIGSFSAASNVTGILTPTYSISCLIHRYHGFVFWDYACAGPYVPIDMNPEKNILQSDDEPYKDAVFISPHKFVGGPGTPGLLVAKRWLFQNPLPHDLGGGTVLFVRRDRHTFISDPEHREEGGTPSIIESIRCGLVFKMKDALGTRFIIKKEKFILSKALEQLKKIDGLVILGNTHVDRLPIFSFLFYNNYTGRLVHHDFIATIFNDVFGIQVRSGCACAGPYGLDLLGMSEELAYKFEQLLMAEQTECFKMGHRKITREHFHLQNAIFKPGFVRLNLPYFITDKCFGFVMSAIRLVALHGWSLLPQYEYNAKKGGWIHRAYTVSPESGHLNDVSFAPGYMKINKTVGDTEDTTESTNSSDKQEKDYEPILKRAEGLFHDAMSGMYNLVEDKDKYSGGLRDELRWFMTPGEAADIIHEKTVTRVKPQDLPFMPGALASKLGIDPSGHQGRGKDMDKNFIVEYFPEIRSSL